MSSLDDLRRTLSDHADAVTDDALPLRAASVHGRVRRVRRQRRAGAVAALALVVGAGLGLRSLADPPRTVQPAKTVVGLDVPQRVVVSGFPYEIDRAATFVDDTVALPRATQEQAITLVGDDLGTGSATLVVGADDDGNGGEAVARVDARHPQARPYPMSEDASRLRVRFEGVPDDARAGLAVYRATDALAPGVAAPDGTAVLRDSVGGDRLLDGSWAGSGEASTTVSVPREDLRRDRQIEVRVYCRAEGRGLRLHVRSADGEIIRGACDETGREPGFSYGTTAPATGGLQAYVTRGERGPRVRFGDDAMLGLAVYRAGATTAGPLDTALPQVKEELGRLWRLDSVREGALSTLTVRTGEPIAGDRLLVSITGRGTYRTVWTGGATRGTSTYFGNDVSGGAVGTAGILLGGETYDVRTILSGVSRSARGTGAALAIYVPAD